MLDDRQRRVLFEVVRAFLSQGEPVSSGAVLRTGRLEVSSATIRNVMSALEVKGFLHQPHTSAGRVPTQEGLRAFVNALPAGFPSPASDPAACRLDEEVGRLEPSDTESAVRKVGGILSEIVHLTSIISLPGWRDSVLADIHLSALSERRVLVMLVTNDERVYHTIVPMNQALDRVQLIQIQNYLSELAVGLTLEQVRARVMLEAQQLERERRDLLACALEIGQHALAHTRPDVFIEGKFNIFEHAELLEDPERLKHLLELLDEKEQILELLDQVLAAPEPQVFIGSEVAFGLGDSLSLIVCSYDKSAQRRGVLGVLGPTRMDYERVVPLVRYSAGVLSSYFRATDD